MPRQAASEPKKPTKLLGVHVSVSSHTHVKLVSVKKGKKMREFLLEAINEKLEREGEEQIQG